MPSCALALMRSCNSSKQVSSSPLVEPTAIGLNIGLESEFPHLPIHLSFRNLNLTWGFDTRSPWSSIRA